MPKAPQYLSYLWKIPLGAHVSAAAGMNHHLYADSAEQLGTRFRKDFAPDQQARQNLGI